MEPNPRQHPQPTTPTAAPAATRAAAGTLVLWALSYVFWRRRSR